MASSGIVPKKPVNELLVEGVNIISQKHSVLFKESVGKGAVEPFNLEVHLRTPGVSVEMDDVILFHKYFKMFPDTYRIGIANA